MIPHRGRRPPPGPRNPTSATLPTVNPDTSSALPPDAPPTDPDATEAVKLPTTRRRSRYVPAILDAIVPGVGHLVAGRRRRALLFLSPLLVALVLAVWVGLTTSGPRLAATLISSEVIWGLLAAQGLFLLWRLLAVGSSLLDPSPAAARTARRAPDRDPPAGHDRAAGLCRVTRPRSLARRPTRSSSSRRRWRSLPSVDARTRPVLPRHGSPECVPVAVAVAFGRGGPAHQRADHRRRRRAWAGTRT